MDNKLLVEVESLPQVKELQEQIKQIQRDYIAKAKLEEKSKREEYKQWFQSLSEDEKLQEQIRLSKEKTKQLTEKKKELSKSKKSQSPRDARTHLLCVLGSAILKILKENNIEITIDDTNYVLSALYYNYKSSGENIFVSNYLREKNKDSNNGLKLEKINIEDL